MTPAVWWVACDVLVVYQGLKAAQGIIVFSHAFTTTSNNLITYSSNLAYTTTNWSWMLCCT